MIIPVHSQWAARANAEANWGQSWKVDATNGDDSNVGNDASPLASTEELTKRLTTSMPMTSDVTITIAQGTYGTLDVRALQGTIDKKLSIVSETVYTYVGLVESYTVHANDTNVPSVLTLKDAEGTQIADLSSLEGKLLVVVDANNVPTGQSCVADKASALGEGLQYLSVTNFSAYGSNVLLPTSAASIAVGSRIAYATLPTVRRLSMNILTETPYSASSKLQWEIARLKIGLLEIPNLTDNGHVDQCIIDEAVGAPLRRYGYITRSSILGRDLGSSRSVTIYDFYVDHCLMYWSGTANNVSLRRTGSLNKCLLHGRGISVDSTWVGNVNDCGALAFLYGFNASANSRFNVTRLWGQSSVASSYGMIFEARCMGSRTSSTIYGAGTAGDGGQISTAGGAIISHARAAQGWADGEYQSPASLTNGVYTATVRDLGPIPAMAWRESISFAAGPILLTSVTSRNIAANTCTITVTSKDLAANTVTTDQGSIRWRVPPMAQGIHIT